jgi:hypothetical protein
MNSQEKLIKEIKTLSDSIRKKHRALKLGISERDKFLERTFKPVIDPLKEVSNKLGKLSEGEIILPYQGSDVKNEEESDVDTQEESDDSDHDRSKGLIEEEEDESEHDQSKDMIEEEGDESNMDVIKEDGDKSDISNISRLGVDIKFKGDLGRKYLLKMLQSAVPNKNYHVYGARLEGDGIMIGNSKLDVDEKDNIIINGKQYKGTIGLFELVFKTKPVNYSNDDLLTFKNICLETNAHKKGYDSNSNVHRNQSEKYKSIISNLFPSRLEKNKKRFMSTEEVVPFYTIRKKRKVNKESGTSGSGLFKSNYNTNIIYYNNLNKLVNRMRLIHEAMEAGHTGLQNEWVALVDELLNRGIITRRDI